MRPPSLRFLIVFLLAISAGMIALSSGAQSRPARHSPPVRQQGHKASAGPADFVDVSQSSGINFHLTCGGPEKRYIMESMCGGVAVFDFDNDGWMDLLFIDGSTLDDVRAAKCHYAALYRNNHDGTFTDVSAKSGLRHCGWGFGVAVGDFDNDGWEDVYITYLDGGVLYHNNHDGTFSDVTAKAGVGNLGRWGTSVAFGDYDNDGYLDLYIANYVDLDLDHLPEFGQGPFCQYRDIPVSCGPRGLKGSRDRLYHNNGDGTFTDVSDKLAVDPDGYYGLGVLWLDYDKDGCLDLYVANDSSPSLLYHNDCKGGFKEVGVAAGVAYSDDGREQAGMGIDSADYDRDGWPDIIKTNFSDDSNNLYRNDHNGEFFDAAGVAGIGPLSIPYLGFGAKFFDFDNDGWPDIFISNGHVNPQVDSHSFGVTYGERPFLFHNLGDGKFSEVGQQSGAILKKARVGRGAAVGDLLNNGQQDIVATALDANPLLLGNRNRASGHSLVVKTVGTRSNRDGFGARIEIKTGTFVQAQEVRANSSFESASDPRLHFGVGQARHVDSVSIHWPSGKVETLPGEDVDQLLTLQEGKGVVRREAFQSRGRSVTLPPRARLHASQ